MIYHFNENIFAGINAGYGGFASVHFGIDVQARFAKSWLIRAGTNYLNGLISPKKQTAQDAAVSIVKSF
jgi:hypothetical protein